MKGLAVLYSTSKKWDQMCLVFERSWNRHMSIPLEIVRLDPPKKTGRLYGLDTNHHKLNVWRNHFTEDTIFCDCDMMVRADIVDGFEYVSDIGYTVRSTQGRPFNAGVIFARHTTYSKQFLKEWCRIDEKMHSNNKFRKKWSKVVPGMNQPALACMLDEGWEADKVPEVYNICDAYRWKQAKMVHIKSESRNICFHSRRSRFRKKEYQKSLHKAFWAYLGGWKQSKSRFLVEVNKANRHEKMKKIRKGM